MSKQLSHLDQARDFLTSLSENPPQLPYEPGLLPLLFDATHHDSTASVDDLTTLIERSQKLATRVLSIANSATYALESTVTSLGRAVRILGFNEVRSLVVMISAASAIKGARLPHNFDRVMLWQHQLLTAELAKAMAKVLGGGANPDAKPGEALVLAPDEAYVCGLLHDIGMVFLAAARPNIWTAIEEVRISTGCRFAEAENEYWGFDHGLVGAQVLHYWRLPLLITEPINWHHAPDLAPSYRLEARLLSAADTLAHRKLRLEGGIDDDILALLPGSVDVQLLTDTVQKVFESGRVSTLSGLAA